MFHMTIGNKKIQTYKIWNFHAGSPLTIHIIDKNGMYYTKKLGLNLDNDVRVE